MTESEDLKSMDFIKYTKTIKEIDGIKYLDYKPDYSSYHELNGGRVSALVGNYVASHDDTNSPTFGFDDILDLYGTSLERCNGLNPEDLIELGIYAGLALAEEYAENEEADEKEHQCVICGDTIIGFGNNAEPIARGRCCNKCNYKFVIPARIRNAAK